MASGRQRPSSDVDVLVLGDLALGDVVTVLSPVQQMLGREINPVVMTVERFAAQLAEQRRFAVRVLKEPKIFVIGEEREFAELVKNRAAC